MIGNLFKPLSHSDRWLYATLMLTMAAMLAYWRIGVLSILLLIVVFGIRGWMQHATIINRRIDRRQKLCLWLMVAYWLLYVASVFWSDDKTEAWDTVITKIPFAVLPLLFIWFNTDFLDRAHIRGLFYTMLATLSVRFIIGTGISLVKVATGMPFGEAFYWEFDPMGLHHNYLGLYLVIALGFVYTEIRRHWKDGSRYWRIMISMVTGILLLYMLLSDSRSAMVTTALLVCAAMVHIVIIERHWKSGIALAAGCMLLVGAAYLCVPQQFQRFGNIVDAMEAGRPVDDRAILSQCAFDAIEGHWILGFGSGDYMPVLLATYEQHDFQKGIERHMGTHNQYLETVMECGVVGLVLLLSMLLMPLLTHVKRDRRNLLVAMLTTAIMGQIFFESMFNRQMGIQISAFCLCLMILYCHSESIGQEANAA